MATPPSASASPSAAPAPPGLGLPAVQPGLRARRPRRAGKGPGGAQEGLVVRRGPGGAPLVPHTWYGLTHSQIACSAMSPPPRVSCRPGASPGEAERLRRDVHGSCPRRNRRSPPRRARRSPGTAGPPARSRHGQPVPPGSPEPRGARPIPPPLSPARPGSAPGLVCISEQPVRRRRFPELPHWVGLCRAAAAPPGQIKPFKINPRTELGLCASSEPTIAKRMGRGAPAPLLPPGTVPGGAEGEEPPRSGHGLGPRPRSPAKHQPHGASRGSPPHPFAGIEQLRSREPPRTPGADSPLSPDRGYPAGAPGGTAEADGSPLQCTPMTRAQTPAEGRGQPCPERADRGRGRWGQAGGPGLAEQELAGRRGPGGPGRAGRGAGGAAALQEAAQFQEPEGGRCACYKRPPRAASAASPPRTGLAPLPGPAPAPQVRQRDGVPERTGGQPGMPGPSGRAIAEDRGYRCCLGKGIAGVVGASAGR
ncbi:collagen alpha-1(I) chain-like [Cinclus cinclus]|uniref:collagen alpha-1(I) chain-like n=1 Tax=Cinclus cinclus TaxID=127875 RepID=UPI002E162E0E